MNMSTAPGVIFRRFVPTALAVGFLAQSSLGADTVRFKPEFTAGATLTYDIQRTLHLEQSGAGETPGAFDAALELTVKLDVGKVRADGTTELAVQVQRLSFSASSNADKRSFDSTQQPADGAQPDPSTLGFSAACRAVLDSRTRLVIDREGRLSSLDGAENLAESLARAAKVKPNAEPIVLSMLAPEALVDMLTPIVQPTAPEPPLREWAPGSTWTNLRTIPLANLGTVTVSEKWAVGPMESQEVRAEAAVTVSATPPRGVVTAAPKLAVSDAQGNAELRWDSGTGTLVSLSRDLAFSTTLNLGDITLKQTQRSKARVERR